MNGSLQKHCTFMTVSVETKDRNNLSRKPRSASTSTQNVVCFQLKRKCRTSLQGAWFPAYLLIARVPCLTHNCALLWCFHSHCSLALTIIKKNRWLNWFGLSFGSNVTIRAWNSSGQVCRQILWSLHSIVTAVHLIGSDNDKTSQIGLIVWKYDCTAVIMQGDKTNKVSGGQVHGQREPELKRTPALSTIANKIQKRGLNDLQ